MTPQEAFVVLNAVPGLGPAKIRELVGHFGSPQEVLQAGHKPILASGIVSGRTVENINHFSKDKFLEDEYNLGQRKGVRILTTADEGFPHHLQEIPDAPVVLYILGDMQLLHAASVAIVGSRISSQYGRATAAQFAREFAQAGLVVVSGLARGIDTAAHQGCLNASGKTLAVIGCGLNYVYPNENVDLMARILERGAVISEMPMATPPVPVNFPRRNRIISGLTLATVVIDAGEKSGALITSGYALDQGRDVFAVPANVDLETSLGSNKLIQDGARVALNAADVLEELDRQIELMFPEQEVLQRPKPALSEDEMAFYSLLSHEPVHFDVLVNQARRPVGQAAGIMLNLELKGTARQLPGGYYIKV